jgi:hypothetical protein
MEFVKSFYQELRCFVGWHFWQTKEKRVVTRTCSKCAKKQVFIFNDWI